MARNTSAFWRCARNTMSGLMGDECYSHFVYEPHKPFSIASAKDSKERVIIIGSVSKTFAMTGWRMGYTLGPEPLIQAIIKMQSQSTSNPTSIAQYAALEAMRGSMDTVPVMLAEYAKRRKRIVEGLREIPGVTCEWPGGAFYAFPNMSALLNGKNALAKSCTDLAKQLLDQRPCRAGAWRSVRSSGFSAAVVCHFH